MPGIDNATFFTLRSSKRCITVMVLTKLALLAHLPLLAGAQQRSSAYTELQ